MNSNKTYEIIRIDFSPRRPISAASILVHNSSRNASALVLMAITAAVCSAQSVTPAHSGTLHYFEGSVSVDSAAVQSKAGRFSQIKEQGVLRTARGRAEVLLTPGVFLRVGENSAIKMIDNSLVSTRVEILSGTIIVEWDDPQMSLRDSPITLIYKDFSIRLLKHGLVEIGSDPAQIKVYRGEAVVDSADAGTANSRATLRKGRLLPFSAALVDEKFNDKVGDNLLLWARDRSQTLSAANMSAERSIELNDSVFGNHTGIEYTSVSLSRSGAWR